MNYPDEFAYHFLFTATNNSIISSFHGNRVSFSKRNNVETIAKVFFQHFPFNIKTHIFPSERKQLTNSENGVVRHSHFTSGTLKWFHEVQVIHYEALFRICMCYRNTFRVKLSSFESHTIVNREAVIKYISTFQLEFVGKGRGQVHFFLFIITIKEVFQDCTLIIIVLSRKNAGMDVGEIGCERYSISMAKPILWMIATIATEA